MGAQGNGDAVSVPRSQVVVVLGAVASAIGVIGFVAAVGGIVYWLRFTHLNLPADTMVASIPRDALVATGLSTLLPFIVWGFIAVCLAYILDVGSLVPNAPNRRSSVLEPTPTKGNGSIEDQPTRRLHEIATAAQLEGARAEDDANAGVASVIAVHTHRINHLDETLEKEFGWIDTATETPELPQLRASLKQARGTIESARRKCIWATREAQRRKFRAGFGRWAAVITLVAVEFVIVVVTGGFRDLSLWQTIAVCAIGVGLAALTYCVGRQSRGFPLFGAAIFVSIVVFGTVVSLWRTYHTPTVQPFAVVRLHGAASLTGYFLAQTSDSIYLARIANGGDGSKFRPYLPRLVVIPRGDVAAVEVGPLQTPRDAYGASYVLLQEICGQLGTQKQIQACERAH